MQLHLKDGSVIEATSRPTPDGGWVSAHEDVTERLQYEKALREQNILFDAAIESMAHGICVFDEDWRVVVHNTRYLELYGLDPQRVKPGTPVIDLVRFSLAEGVHVRTEQSAEEFFEDFKRRIVENGDEPVVRRFADGRLIAVRNQPMENGGWVCTFEDITERERAAEALKEQHRRFDIALNNMAHGLCMFDADMRLIVSNKRYAEMFNLPRDFVRPGISVRDVIAKSHALGNYSHRDVTAYELYDTYAQMLKAGDVVVHRHLADGRMIKITHEPMAKGGWVAIYEDITERYRAEQSIAHMARHDALTDLPNRVLFPRAHGGRAFTGREERRGARLALPRPRQLQGRQRHARPSDRRPAARCDRGARPRRRP
jgi:PAS domain S-box-containing protein